MNTKSLSESSSLNEASRRMKQSTAIKLLSGISIVALIMMFGMLFWSKIASNQFDFILSNKETLITGAERFADTSSYLTQEARSYAATSKKQHYDNYWKEVNTDKNRELALENMRAIGITDGEESMITQMASISNDLVPLEDKSMELASKGNTEEAVAILYGDQYQDGMTQIGVIAENFRKSIETRMQENLDAQNKIISLSFVATFVCLFSVALIQMVIIFYVNKRIISPLLIIKENMLQMSQGNLQTGVGLVEDQTEIGQLTFAIKETKARTACIIEDIRYVMGELANGNFTVASNQQDSYIGDYEPILYAMNMLKEKQNNTIAQIEIAAEQVSNGSSQVSSGAQALAQGATEQASSVEELSATISDISEEIEANTKRVVSATQLAEDTGNETVAGNKKMDEMVLAMKEISAKSGQISNIIKTIDDIAFQTNILALNAAVEAARAGNAGKGFAVVADEVRNLASKSAAAAQNTTDLIADSISAVEKGALLADETATSLQIVSTNADKIVKIIREIKTESELQLDRVTQIAIGVEQISSVVQTNSATAEESAAASEELSGQAAILKNLVSEFHLER